MRVLISIAALVGVCGLAFPAATAELLVSPKSGESLEDVARRVYGKPERASVLARHNAVESAAPGQQLRAPISDRRVVVRGETWSSLAGDLLGDATLGRELARVVTGDASSSLRAGAPIAVPIVVEERLAKGETLAAISRRYYGGPGRAELLARVNGVSDPRRLRPGARIKVPLVLEAPETTTAGPVPAAAAEAAGRFDAALVRAGVAYREGDFSTAREQLESLRPEVEGSGDAGAKRQLLEQLLFVQVAFDQPEDACDSYTQLRVMEPTIAFDPDQVSPKIRRVVERCGV